MKDLSMFHQAIEALNVMATSEKALHSRITDAWHMKLYPFNSNQFPSELGERYNALAQPNLPFGTERIQSEAAAKKEIEELVHLCAEMIQFACAAPC